MQRRARFVVAGFLMLAAIGVLVGFGLRSTGMRHFTPDQLIAHNQPVHGGVQVDGFVVAGSTVQMDDLKFAFQVADKDEQAKVQVIYTGIKPDSFKEGEGVVIEGTYDYQNRRIHATKLMTKCPSKYEAKETEGTTRS